MQCRRSRARFSSYTVPHKPSSGNLVIVKNLTKLSQLTIGIFKGKKIFLTKKSRHLIINACTIMYKHKVECHVCITQQWVQPRLSELQLLSFLLLDVQPDRTYRFNVTSNVYFNAGYRGDVQGQNFRVNIADFEDGVVVVVKYIDEEFIFSAASPDIARSMFRKEDQHALLTN